MTAIPRISRPVNSALSALGASSLEQVAGRSEREIASLHGMGPRGMRILREAMREAGLAFRPAERSLARHQRMVCFDDGLDRFQMRAAGIALREGHVLVHRAVHEAFWSLPGGRVEQGEASTETLFREMQEELLVDVEVGPLAFVLESFFPNIGQQFHEIGFYHRMTVPESFPFAPDGVVCHTIFDAVMLEFRWVRASESALGEAAFHPARLRPFIASPQTGTMHIIDRD